MSGEWSHVRQQVRLQLMAHERGLELDMTLERFCRKPVITVRPHHTVFEAAEKMRSEHVGAVVVTEEEGGRPTGMLTDRDIVCRVVGATLNPASTSVSRVMSANPEVARTSDTIDVVAFRMREKGVRRLPIVNQEEKVVGMVSLDDLVVLLTSELTQTAVTIRDNRGP